MITSTSTDTWLIDYSWLVNLRLISYSCSEPGTRRQKESVRQNQMRHWVSINCQSPWHNHFRIHHDRSWHFTSPIWVFWQMCTCWHTSVCLWQIVVKTCNLHRWLSWKWHYVCRVAMFAQTKQILVHNMYIGSGDSSVSAGLVIERSQVWTPAGVVREFSSSWSTFWADSYLGISSTPVLLQ